MGTIDAGARENAQQAALRGEPDRAIQAWSELLSAGDCGAAASLAELHAWKLQWAPVLRYCGIALAAPQYIYSLNVSGDMVALAAQAGLQTKAWSDLANVAIAAEQATPDDDRYDTTRTLLQQLKQFASAQGRASFPSYLETPGIDDGADRYAAAMARLAAGKVAKKSQQERAQYLIAVAGSYRYREGAVDAYDREKAVPALFDHVAFLCSALVQAGRSDEAWSIFIDALPRWWPVEVLQCAPMSVFHDTAFSSLITPARSLQVLGTPRGTAV